jgi:hypothetical protein
MSGLPDAVASLSLRRANNLFLYLTFGPGQGPARVITQPHAAYPPVDPD